MKSFNEKTKLIVASWIKKLIEEDWKAKASDIYKRFMNELLWAATETGDDQKRLKYFGQTYWSERAIKSVVEKMNDNKKGKQLEEGLRHEHAVPKKILIKKIEEKYFKNPDKNEINIFLKNYAHAVVVTKEDDDTLTQNGVRSEMPEDKFPHGSEPNDVFARYKKSGIKVYDVGGKMTIDRKVPDKSELLKKRVV